MHLRGDDREFFLEPSGQAEVLRATEHLLLRLYGAALQPRALRLTGEGFRERRDAALAAEARRVAEAVRGDGVGPQHAVAERLRAARGPRGAPGRAGHPDRELRRGRLSAA